MIANRFNSLSLISNDISIKHPKENSDALYQSLNLYQTLISTSTPLGNSSFMSASMVFEEDE